jgi:hypothetical protein
VREPNLGVSSILFPLDFVVDVFNHQHVLKIHLL